MNLAWISTPAALYGALALCLAACFLFFLSSRMEIQAIRRQVANSSNFVAASVDSLSAEVEQIRQGVQELETAPTAAQASLEGLNLTRRAQALRMHHRGEPVPTIAAALRAPQNEVELLLKVQRLLSPE